MNKKYFFYIFVLIATFIVVFFSNQYSFIVPAFAVVNLILFWIILFTDIFKSENKALLYEDGADKPNLEESNIKKSSIISNLKPLVQTISAVQNSTDYYQLLFAGLHKEVDIFQGILFLKNENTDAFIFAAQYAYFSDDYPLPFKTGEGLHGQVALNKTVLFAKEFSDRVVGSGLGATKPVCLAIIPLIDSNHCVYGVIELSFVKELTKDTEIALNYLSENLIHFSAPTNFSN